jgi:hypothetical protein
MSGRNSDCRNAKSPKPAFAEAMTAPVFLVTE